MARDRTNRFEGLELIDGRVVLRFSAGGSPWAFQLAPEVADQLLDAIRELRVERAAAGRPAWPTAQPRPARR